MTYPAPDDTVLAYTSSGNVNVDLSDDNAESGTYVPTSTSGIGASPLVTFNWDPLTQLQNFLAAEAAVENGTATQPVSIVALGDSTTRGYGAASTGWSALSYVNELSQALNTDGAASQTDNFLASGISPSNGETEDYRVAMVNGATNPFVIDAGGTVIQTSAAGQGVDFSLNQAGDFDRVTINYLDVGDGSVTVALNGGPVLATLQFGNSGQTLSQTIDVPAGEYSQLNIRATNSNPDYIEGASFWNSTSPAISVYNAGIDGITSAAADTSTVNGSSVMGSTAGYGPTAGVAALAPKLVLIDLGINDLLQGNETTSQIVSNISQMVASLRSAGSDVIVVIPTPFSDPSYAAGLPALRSALESYSLSANVPLIDLSATYDNSYSALAAADLMADNVHPNATLYADIGAQIAALLSKASAPVVTLAASEPTGSPSSAAVLGAAVPGTSGDALSVTLLSDSLFSSGSSISLSGDTLLYTPAAYEPNVDDTITYMVTDTTTGVVNQETQVVNIDGPSCFCPGTRIMTDRGEIEVERLEIGDRVLTGSGGVRPIRWIGRRSYCGWLAATNAKVWPIRLRPGAIADGLPKRDLWLSPEHALYINGALVPAGLLVNGTSITQRSDLQEVHYLHLELAEHDVLLAEGAWAESYIDDGGRGVFHNAAEHRRLYPDELASPRPTYCAPRLEDGMELERLRVMLAARGARLQSDGRAKPAKLCGYLDAASHAEMVGWAYDAHDPKRAVELVALCDGVVIGRLAADRYRRDLAAAGVGDGGHAFTLRFVNPLDPQTRHILEIRHAEDWTLLEGSPWTLDPQGFGGLALGELAGHIDRASHGFISGWACDKTQPCAPVGLIISVNDRVIGRVTANRSRSDLVKTLGGDGRHGFEFPIPERLSRKQAHIIRVRREMDGADLPSSPKILPAVGGYKTHLEEALEEIVLAASAEDEAQVLAVLAEKTEEILARRAERTGAREDREVMTAFQRRWGPQAKLADADRTRAQNQVLVIDTDAPVAKEGAGAGALLSHMRAFKALGYDVTFLASRAMGRRQELEALAEREGVTVRCKPYYSGVEDVLGRHGPEFDLIYLHRLYNARSYMALCRTHAPKARIIYSVADLHHLRMERQARLEARPELMGQARLTERAEIQAAYEADLVVTHSSYEAAKLGRHLDPRWICVAPFAVEASLPAKAFDRRDGLVFVGGFTHAPNPDAVHWLIYEILPRVWRLDASIVCAILGHGWSPTAFGGLDPRVRIVGPVEDVGPYLSAARLGVAPLRFGAGVKGKVLEAFAAGIPCVMTGVAAEGLPIQGPLTQMLAEGADGLAEAIVRLHNHQAANVELGRAALSLVRQRFSQSQVEEALEGALRGLAPTPSARAQS